jgi:hypothetical protein
VASSLWHGVEDAARNENTRRQLGPGIRVLAWQYGLVLIGTKYTTVSIPSVRLSQHSYHRRLGVDVTSFSVPFQIFAQTEVLVKNDAW